MTVFDVHEPDDTADTPNPNQLTHRGYALRVLEANHRGHPSVLETEVVRLRRQNATLRGQLAAVQGVGALVPAEYAEELDGAAFLAYGVAETQAGRVWSEPCPVGATAQESRRLRPAKTRAGAVGESGRELRSATERAAERPDAPLWRHR